MVYKDLALNRDKILDVIKSFADNTTVTTEEKAQMIKYTIKVPTEKEALLAVYPVKDGTTTLYANVGKNTTLSLEISQHIIKNCQVPKIENKILSIRKMSDVEYDSLIEFLTDCGLVISEIRDLETGGKQSKLTANNVGTLYLNKWATGTFSVQGSSDVLKGMVIEGLTNLLPYKEIIEAQLNSLKVKSRVEDILIDLKNALPNSFDFLDNTLHAIISPSLVLKKSELVLLDYSCFTFPALRGLEGYIKKLFFEKDIVISGTFSDYIENGKVRANLITKINNANIVEAIEKCYDYYKNNRHVIFHIDGTIIGTNVIDDVNVADSIINDTFTLIESTYKKIVNGK
jgi:hypothetical protein